MCGIVYFVAKHKSTIHGQLERGVAMSEKQTAWVLADARALPEVFLKVLKAKELLASGEANSAAEAARRGHDVTLIAGPVALKTPKGVERVDVTSAREMMGAVKKSLLTSCCGDLSSEHRSIGASDHVRNFLTIHSAAEHNLKNVTARIPVGSFTVVTGVSGSGKSTLIDETLKPALMNHFYGSKEKPGKYKKITGILYRIASGKLCISAELLDRNGNCLVYAPASRVERSEDESGES